MLIPDIGTDQIARACRGDIAAVDATLGAIQPGVYNLAVRMLGNAEDARDATQEILLKVVTHLGGFRGEARFSTWVWSIARHQLLGAVTRTQESPIVSLEALQDKLADGLRFAATLADPSGSGQAVRPEDWVEAQRVALACTQGMLMAMPRTQRLAYVLDVVLGLTSTQAAEVLEVPAATYRKRLSRAKAQLHGFMQGICGLANPSAPCRCDRQLPALRARDSSRTADRGPQTGTLIAQMPAVRARKELQRMIALADAAAVFRAQPEYRAPATMVAAIRVMLQAHGFWDEARIQ